MVESFAAFVPGWRNCRNGLGLISSVIEPMMKVQSDEKMGRAAAAAARPEGRAGLRLKDGIDDMDNAVRLVDVGDGYMGHAAFRIFQHDVIAVHGGGE